MLEAYGEVQVPMSKKLQTDFALRETRNEASSSTDSTVSGSHDFESWKASAIYDPLQWLRVRATVSRDVRAAGFRELFLPRVTVQSGVFPANVTNPWAGGASDQFAQTTGGYPGLKPETADTYTLGTVFSFDKLRFSVDWFKIDLQDAITQSPGNQPLVDQCFRSGGGACDRVTGHGTGDITAIDSSAINLAGFLTSGWDYEVNYAVPMRSGGNLNFRFIGTYLYDMIVNTGLGAAPIDYAGQSGPVASFGSFNTQPKWQARAFVTWQRKKFTTTFETTLRRVRHAQCDLVRGRPGVGGRQAAVLGHRQQRQRCLLPELVGVVRLGQGKEGKGTQIFWAVNNLLGKDPPGRAGRQCVPDEPGVLRYDRPAPSTRRSFQLLAPQPGSGACAPLPRRRHARHCAPMKKKAFCGADASATINRDDFGIDFWNQMGFKMSVTRGDRRQLRTAY